MPIEILPVRGMPEITPGADLAGEILAAMRQSSISLQEGDVVVVAQKVVSKAEGRLIDPGQVTPSAFAETVAAQTGKEPGEVELILRESRRMVRMARSTLIMETRHGFVCANAGIDRSNVGGGMICLLPLDPDASARQLRSRLLEETGATVAVIISDTFGRAWRHGQTNIAIGVAGMSPFQDYRGSSDVFGAPLRVTQIAVADELAGAAELVMGKTEAVPVAIIRGYAFRPEDGRAVDMVRDADSDLFR